MHLKVIGMRPAMYAIGILLLVLCVPVVSATTIQAYARNDAFTYSDAYFYVLGTDFSTMRNQASSSIQVARSTGIGNILATGTSPNYAEFDRAGLCFNSSDLPDDATISDAKLSIYGYAKYNQMGGMSSVITGFNPSNPNELVAGDFSKFTQDIYAANTTYTAFNDGGRNNITLTNTTFINKTGYSCLMWRNTADVDNTTPSGAAWNNKNDGTAFYDTYKGTTYVPFIEINYTVGGADTTPPSSVTNLAGTVPACTSINVSWTNPSDAQSTDFNHTMLYIDNTLHINASNSTTYHEFTGLTNGTSYLFSTRTVDITGNVNTSWQNVTVNSDCMPPVSDFSCTPLSGAKPLSITCTDASSPAGTSWFWYNNTTQVSTSRNPTFTINTIGKQDIKLKSVNSYGEDWENKTEYVDVGAEGPTTFLAFVIGNNTLSDGMIYKFATDTYANLHDASSGTASLARTNGIGDGLNTPASPSGQYNEFDRAAWCGNTTLPTGAVISDAKFSVYGYAKSNQMGGMPGVLTTFSPTDPTSLADGDFSKFGNDLLSGNVTYAAFNDAGRNNITITNTSYINKTGYTCLMWRNYNDYVNVEPSWSWAGSKNDRMEWHDTSKGDPYVPFLEINYTLGTTIAPVANFTSNQTSGSAPLGVGFTDESTNDPTAWNWSLNNVTGNNTVIYWSTDKNPSIILGEGNWSFALNSSNLAGYNITHDIYWINVSEQEPLDYYAYGDSITYNSNYYLGQMVATHDPTKTVDHNVDGWGQKSDWGLANWATHPGDPYPVNVYILFGANDKGQGYSAEWTYLNLEQMYTNYTAQGSDTKILIETFEETDERDWTTLANQSARIMEIQNYLDSKDIPYVKAYDAIDLNPGNCLPDGANTSYLSDSTHPTAEGHRLIGEYIWAGTCAGDTTPPPSISNLANTTTCNSINWTWTNPGEVGDDHNETVIWKDNVLYANVSNTTSFSQWDGLSGWSQYTFSSKTKDIDGNLNTTWQNQTATAGYLCKLINYIRQFQFVPKYQCNWWNLFDWLRFIRGAC